MPRWLQIALTFVLFAGTMLVVGNHASALDSATLRSQCEEYERLAVVNGDKISPSGNRATFCLGYFAAIMDAMKTIGPDDNHLLFVCLPIRVSADQGIRIFLNHTKSRPQDLHLDSMYTIAAAFQAAYPCRNGSGKP